MTLRAHRLACQRGARRLFDHLDFTLDAGDAMRVAGANGSGKTSLLRMLCGLGLPSAGEVRWKERDIRAQREEFSAELIYLGHAHGVKDDLLAWENVVVASALTGHPLSATEARAALARMGLDAVADLPARVLSQGQRKRIALARLSVKAPLWILDEPFAALDQLAIEQLCGTLNAHLAQGGMVVYSTHQEVALTARRALCLDLSRERAC